MTKKPKPASQVGRSEKKKKRYVLGVGYVVPNEPIRPVRVGLSVDVQDGIIGQMVYLKIPRQFRNKLVQPNERQYRLVLEEI